MNNILFSDAIVNATELRNNQKRWLEIASTKPVTVSYGRKQLALIDREQVNKLYKAVFYLELVMKACEEYRNDSTFTVLPWVKRLSEDNRAGFHDELIRTALDATVSGDWDEVEYLMQDWKATAEVESNPDLAKALMAEENPSEYVGIEDQV